MLALIVILTILSALNLSVLFGIWSDITQMRKAFQRLCRVVERWDMEDDEEQN